jgi:hypothetical protein
MASGRTELPTNGNAVALEQIARSQEESVTADSTGDVEANHLEAKVADVPPDGGYGVRDLLYGPFVHI